MELFVEIIIAVLLCAALFGLTFYVRGKMAMPVRTKDNVRLSVNITARDDAPELEHVVNAVLWGMPDAEITIVDGGMASEVRKMAELLEKNGAISIQSGTSKCRD